MKLNQNKFSNIVPPLKGSFCHSLNPKKIKTEGNEEGQIKFSALRNIDKKKFHQLLRKSEIKLNGKVGNLFSIKTQRKGNTFSRAFTDREKKIIMKRSKQKMVHVCRDHIKLFSPDKPMVKFNRKMKEIKQISKRTYQGDGEKQTLKERFQVYWESIKGTKHSENQDYIKFSEGIFIVCDGHGSNGRKVASFVANTLYNKLLKEVEEGKMNQSIIFSAYEETQFQLQLSGFDIAFSGCTALVVIIVGEQVYCANVGDCKAFLRHGYKDQILSFEHKPDKPGERERIQNNGGVIRQMEIGKDKFVGPLRIWAPGKNSYGPGLALSRAFGDKAAKKLGVISQPQINEFTLNDNGEFIVMGSDGLFDQLSLQDIVEQVRKQGGEYGGRENICERLASEAKIKWQEQSDDISIILIFL